MHSLSQPSIQTQGVLRKMNTPSADALIKALRPYLFPGLETRSKAVLALSDLHFGNRLFLFQKLVNATDNAV
jgi:hypothetical protein